METYFPDIEEAHSHRARQRVLTDLRTLSRDAEALLRVTVSDMSEQAKAARARLTAALEHAKVTCSELQRETTAALKAAATKTDAVIREHPYESIGVAFGVGVLIGVLVARRN